jgi:hypothetical protein
MGTKHPMSFSSSCFIEPHSSHCLFSLSHTTTTPISTFFPMQSTTHQFPLPILTLHVNVEPQPNTFLIPLNNTHVKPSPPSIMPTLIVVMIKPLNLPPILPTCLQPPPRAPCPTCGINLPFKG